MAWLTFRRVLQSWRIPKDQTKKSIRHRISISISPSMLTVRSLVSPEKSQTICAHFDYLENPSVTPNIQSDIMPIENAPTVYNSAINYRNILQELLEKSRVKPDIRSQSSGACGPFVSSVVVERNGIKYEAVSIEKTKKVEAERYACWVWLEEHSGSFQSATSGMLP
jgi:hypothetical protein